MNYMPVKGYAFASGTRLCIAVFAGPVFLILMFHTDLSQCHISVKRAHQYHIGMGMF